MKFKIGKKVTYKTPYKCEKGIIKSISDEDYSFVVYHCNDDWDNYKEYTAARTPNANLVPGWVK